MKIMENMSIGQFHLLLRFTEEITEKLYNTVDYFMQNLKWQPVINI